MIVESVQLWWLAHEGLLVLFGLDLRVQPDGLCPAVGYGLVGTGT